MGGMVSKDVIDQIRNSLDIADVIGSYIQVKRMGHVAKALCPFHKEKTPSFHINPARQAFHCFGCGVGGDVFKFVMQYENVDFPTALRLLASRAGIALQFDEDRGGKHEGPAKDELFGANEEASALFHKELLQSPEAAEARAYLEKRSLGVAVWKEWGIGYAPTRRGFLSGQAGQSEKKIKALTAAGLLSPNDDGSFYERFYSRVMFTIRDELGRAVGFSGRIMKTEDKTIGKYVNTPETPVFRKSRILFGLDKAKRNILDKREVLLCEGQIDCIRCHLAGFHHTVASQGTAFTEEHARLLRRYADKVIIVLDGDAAGQKAALKNAELLISEGVALELATLPAGEDPDSLILKGGPEAFANMLKNVHTPMGFLIERLKAGERFHTQEGLLVASREALELASHAQSAVQAERMLREAAVGLGVGFDSLQRDLRAMQQKAYRPRPAPEPVDPAVLEKPLVRPVDEVELAVLLGTRRDPELAGLVRRWLPYPLISDPVCRAVIHVLAEEEEDLMAALDEESDECKAFAAQIVNAPQKVLGTEADMGTHRAAQDMMLRIWQRHLEVQRGELIRRMQALQGAERQQVTQEFAQLLLDQVQLKQGWEKASRILDLYLQRMADV